MLELEARRVGIRIMQDELQDQIVYGENHIRFLQDEIEREEGYQLRVKRKKQKNHNKFLFYNRLIYAIVCLIIIMLFWMAFFTGADLFRDGFKHFFAGNIPNAILTITWGPILIGLIIGLVLCIRKMRFYSKYLKGTDDPRTGVYKAYEEMLITSQGRMKYLHQDLLQAISVQEVNKKMIEERRIRQTEMAMISMDELREVQGETQETVSQTTGMGRLLE